MQGLRFIGMKVQGFGVLEFKLPGWAMRPYMHVHHSCFGPKNG